MLKRVATWTAVLLAVVIFYGDAMASSSPQPTPRVAAFASEPSAVRPELVAGTMVLYDNTGGGSTKFYAGQGGHEAIDDVHGVATGILSGVAFEYNDPSTSGGTISATVRLYSNPRGLDGGITLIGGPYVVDNLPRGRNFASLVIDDGPEMGPDAWMGVRFSSTTAGLIISEEPTVGISHDYYLESSQFFYFSGNPKANFALRVAVDEPPEGVALIALGDRVLDGRPDEILRISDLELGAAEFIGTLANNFDKPQSIAVYPATSQLPAGDVTLLNRIFIADSDRLLEVDRPTGNGVVIGDIGFALVTGLAFHPSQTLYAVTSLSGYLLAIDLNTGVGTVVAQNLAESKPLNDLAFHPDGRALVLSEQNNVIYHVDLTTGATIHKWILSSQWHLDSILWSLDGQTLYSIADTGRENRLVSIQLSATTQEASISFVSRDPMGVLGVEGLAWLGRSAAGTLLDGNTSAQTQVPTSFRLYANRPNPFNPTTQIDFDLLRAGVIDIRIYDVRGMHVTTLLQGWREGGRHHVTWTGRNQHGIQATSGVYYYTLESNDERATRQMILVR